MMKLSYLLTGLFLLIFVQISAQDVENNEDEIIKYKQKFEVTSVGFHYSVSNFPFVSNTMNHGYELFNYQTPNWFELESSMQHEPISEILIGMNLTKQLYDRNSSYYSNLFIGLYACSGNRINVKFKSEYKSLTDEMEIDSIKVINVDTTIVRQLEYYQKTRDLGLNIIYGLSTPPTNQVVAELGLGFAFLVSAYNRNFVSEIYSQNVKWQNSFNNRTGQDVVYDRELVDYKAETAYFLRFYLPAVFSYKFAANNRLALSSYLNLGIEFQKTINTEMYSYPFFSLALGLKYYL
jgi:hypothetical protein